MSDRLEGHTVRRYDAELGHCNTRVLELGGLVLEQLHQVLLALQDWDGKQAVQVIERDSAVRKLQKAVETDVIQVLATRTPVARDLRAVIGMSKATADLGRVEEKVVNVAEVISRLFNQQTINPPENILKDLTAMGRAASGRLHQALDIFDRGDVNAAEALLSAGKDFNAWFQSDLRRLTTFVMEDARMIGLVIEVVLALLSLERIGEYAVNLCENVIYQVTGEDVQRQAVAQ